MVFYFTGTGNSLYIAKQIEENPISIPQVMRQDHLEFTADSIGIAVPDRRQRKAVRGNGRNRQLVRRREIPVKCLRRGCSGLGGQPGIVIEQIVF